jgi:hypothetical protein
MTKQNIKRPCKLIAHTLFDVALGIFLLQKRQFPTLTHGALAKKLVIDQQERISNASLHDFCRKNFLITIDVHMRAGTCFNLFDAAV